MGWLTPNRDSRKNNQPFFMLIMDPLNLKYQDFKKINQYTFNYLLENGREITFKVRQNQFPHLIGLHKLTDIRLIAMFIDPSNSVVNAKYINSKIKKEELTDAQVQSSAFFSEIRDRYNYLSSEAILSLAFNEVIIDFDKTLLTTNLQSDYIFTDRKTGGNLYLGIVRDGTEYYPETFFFNSTNYYTRGQTIIGIKRIRIYDANKNLLLEQCI